MRLRNRLVAGFVIAHLGLSMVLAAGSWTWLDRQRREAASESARAVGQVLAKGGFSPTPEVLERMRTLTGYDFRLLEAGEATGSDTVRVQVGGRTIAIVYRTAAYEQAERELWWAVLAWSAAGSGAFAAVAAWHARRLTRPVEDLAEAARRLGLGAWGSPVVVAGEGEVALLAQAIEALRRRLVDLLAEGRRAERLATLGGFTATIAHEVRNPLSAIRLTIQGLAVRQPGEPGLQLVEEEVERLDLIVDELLAFSRGMAVEAVACDLAVPAGAVIRLLARQADHLGVDLRLEDGAGHRVLADDRRLRQVLLNLVLNALQAAARGEASAPAVVVRVVEGGLEVEDNGPGVPEPQRERLFQPFASDRPDGTGLGLHLARTIAEAHGATLTVDSRPGHTVFRLAGLSPA